MLLGIHSTQTNYNTSFKDLKIKNKYKMSNKVIEALINAKDVFADYPNASVRLKHKGSSDRINHYWAGSYPGSLTYYTSRNLDSLLIFNLGEKYKGKTLKFAIDIIDYKRFEGSLVGVWLRRTGYILSGKTAIMKKHNIEKMPLSINKETLSQEICNAKKTIDIKLAEKQKREDLLKIANV